MSRFLFLLSVVLAALLAVLIGAMNADRVEIELAFVRFTSPVGLALIVAFVIGLLAGLFWQVYWVAELLSERGRLRRALRLAESRARAAAADAG
ncbi:MAG: lipopolysaccharide assembly protein LapA domain-containing protein [Steroidobacter sp.]